MKIPGELAKLLWDDDDVWTYDRLREFVATVQADAQPQWQPIETAPKEGAWLIVFVPFIVYSLPNEWGCFVAHWAHQVQSWWGKGIGQIGKPTHWMPLPEPPK